MGFELRFLVALLAPLSFLSLYLLTYDRDWGTVWLSIRRSEQHQGDAPRLRPDGYSQQKQKKKRRLVVAGTAQNSAGELEFVRRSIVSVLQDSCTDFELVRVVVYENDSKDKTAEIVRSWNCTTNCTFGGNSEESTGGDGRHLLGGKVELISESYKDIPNASQVLYGGRDYTKVLNKGRTLRLAYARNRALSRVRSLYREQGPFDYVLLLDMDEVNKNLRGLGHCFTDLPVDWGACCANQPWVYYDLWAARTRRRHNGTIVISGDYEEWLRCDIFADCDYEFKGLLSLPVRHISANEPPIMMRSCFGGAALYHARYIIEGEPKYHGSYPASYGPELEGKETIEHYTFNEEIYARFHNFTIYIQPRMMNDGPGFWSRRDTLRKIGRHKPQVSEAIKKSHADPSLACFYNHNNNSHCESNITDAGKRACSVS